jgi:hypothetical protein
MDPFLEHHLLWPGVHNQLIVYLTRTLNQRIPKHYVARIEERLYVVQPERAVYPDVILKKRRRRSRADLQPAAQNTAVALAGDPPWEILIEREEVREPYIDIIEVPAQRRVVTTIEILSPANKASGSEGRRQYQAKQEEILAGPVHLLEIDLLRGGSHTVVVPRELILVRGSWDYLVSLSRGGQRHRGEVWAITLKQRLPRIRVPLAGKDPDVIVDLQELLNHAYDDGAYDREIDYRGNPSPPLTGADADWADALLRQAGLRPKKKRST